MMKKLFKPICLILCCAFAFLLAACNAETKRENETAMGVSANQISDLSTNSETKTKEKVLVVYFSMPDNVDDSSVLINGETLGNTQYMAQLIQKNTGGDIFRILPKTPYTTDHDELVDLAKKEQQENARPEINDTIENFEDYDTVFVGYPTWWSDMPMIMYTFFDTYDFSGKTIVTFNTHGGSGFSGTNQTIAELEPNAVVINGLSVSRNDIENGEAEIVNWLKEIGYSK
ncbi:MAG: flavodoxin [Acutalibacteraceae bacterium]